MAAWPKASSQISRFRPRLRAVPRHHFLIWPKASRGSAAVPRGSAYSRLCYRGVATTYIEASCIKFPRASSEAMRSNRHQHRAPTMQGYDIVAARQHAPTHRLSFPLRLPAKSCTTPSLTPWGSLRNHAQLQASPSSSDFSGLWYRDTMTTNTQNIVSNPKPKAGPAGMASPNGLFCARKTTIKIKRNLFRG